MSSSANLVSERETRLHHDYTGCSHSPNHSPSYQISRLRVVSLSDHATPSAHATIATVQTVPVTQVHRPQEVVVLQLYVNDPR